LTNCDDSHFSTKKTRHGVVRAANVPRTVGAVSEGLHAHSLPACFSCALSSHSSLTAVQLVALFICVSPEKVGQTLAPLAAAPDEGQRVTHPCS